MAIYCEIRSLHFFSTVSDIFDYLAILMLMMIILQAFENNEERQRNRRESSEELPAPVVDKVCDIIATISSDSGMTL